MREILFILGLPGSGKTTLAESFLPEYPVLIDDLCRAHRPAEVLAGAGDKVVITDPRACRFTPVHIKQKLEDWGGPCKVRFIAFENDVEACWANLKARADGRDISLSYVKSLAEKYKPDEWGEVRPVYKKVDG